MLSFCLWYTSCCLMGCHQWLCCLHSNVVHLTLHEDLHGAVQRVATTHHWADPHLLNCRMTRKIYIWSESIAGDNCKNWAWKTKHLLDDIKDFGGVLTIDELWDALAQQETIQWKNTVLTRPQSSETGGRFRFYRKFKPSPAAEGYILNSVTLNKRRVITQLRCGCLPLEIELGRYRSPKPPASERICQLCQSGTGDEPHFLLECPILNQQRQDLLIAMADMNENFTSLSDEDKTVLILDLCASHPAVSNSIYCMYRERCNLLR